MPIVPLRSPQRRLEVETPQRAVGELPVPAKHGFIHTIRGDITAPIVVLCDPPKPEAVRQGLPMSQEGLELFARYAREHGFGRNDFVFLGLCPPLPENALNSQSRKWAHVEKYAPSVIGQIEAMDPRCVVTLGDLATRTVMGRSLAITKARGQPIVSPQGSETRDEEGVLIHPARNARPVFPMLSPAFVLRVPDHMPTFGLDFGGLRRFVDGGYTMVEEQVGDYRWCEDLSAVLAEKPEIIGVDTETTSLVWRDPRTRVLTVQISTRPGMGLVCPVDLETWAGWQGRGRARARLIAQLKTLLEDPTVKKVGHNLKFDIHMLRKLGIELRGWSDDTQLLAFAVDENMMRKGQEECLARWVPVMVAAKGSLTDEDKSEMARLMVEEPDKFLLYAGSDPDGVLRLREVLLPMLEQDRQQLNIYRRILMPGIATFAGTVERFGMGVDRERLREFGAEVETWVGQEYRTLIGMVPAAVRRKHVEAKKELKFSRTDFVRDILFTPEGFNLEPVVFTKSTADLEDDEREASTSSKQHLPYFTDRDDAAGEFCRKLVRFQQAQKLVSTYIGKEAGEYGGRQEPDSGLWQYIAPNGRIYPSYSLSTTVTGRTASRDPNGQNFPKRGEWAKPYQSIFVPTPGYKLINADLSQIELRIAAWMARDAAMLRIYRDGGDIHTATAIAVNGLTIEQWNALPKADRKLMRTKAKAVNFGFLYGMGARKFRSYAKTDYGVNYTERESERTRSRFFSTYRNLEDWHVRMREECHNHGYVRALHGAKRHLPSIYSNDPAIRAGAERQAINSPVQRFGSDLGVMAMARFSACADPERFRIIGFIHDALVMEVKEGYELEGVESLIWAMQSNPLHTWFGLNPPCPILAEGDIGINGRDMLELAELPAEEKQPAWFRDLGFQQVERDGKLQAVLNPRRPVWWDDAVDSESAFEDVIIHSPRLRMLEV